MTFRPYQIEGAKFLASKRYALLADDPGLGKTAQSIRACDAIGARTVAVVCPASVVLNWRREFRRFTTTGIVPYVVSYEKMHTLPELDRYEKFDAVIVDESHYAKSSEAKRTKKLLGADGLIHKTRRVWFLSGTPMPNHPAELWPMLYATGTIRDTLSSFETKFCEISTRPFKTPNGRKIMLKRYEGAKNIDGLREVLRPFMLRRRKEDVLADLPDLTVDDLPLDLDIDRGLSAFGEEYAALRDALKDGVGGLRRIADSVAALRRYLGVAKAAAVKPLIEDMAQAEKVIVFAHHIDVLKELATGTSFGFARVTGDTPQANRQAEIDRFQNDPDCRVFFGQIRAAGVGVTLTAATRVVIVEPSWVPAENEQAIMRAHRFGQKNAVLAQYVTVADSLDEAIMRVVRKKTDTVDRVLNVET